MRLRAQCVVLFVTAVVLGVAPPAWANPPQTFSQGSLIIPMQANYQTACGTVGGYGLVWSILYENRTGGAFDGQPVTVYWTINGSKTSPNRCTPSNRHALPPAPNNGTWNDPAWNDGCDVTITNTTAPPVVPVDYSIVVPVSGMYPAGAITNYTTTTAVARPAFAAVTMDAAVTAPKFETIQYQGAPFVIDGPDAVRVLTAMKTNPRFTKYITAGACGGIGGGQTNWYINMHQATVQFDAPVYKRINKVPPKVALLDLGGGVATGILDQYLTSAGLNFAGAGGTKATPGIIYDALHAVDDLISTGADPKGYLNSKVAGKSRYKVFWTPHWVASSSKVGAGGATAAQITNALENIAYFTDQQGNGLMAECASLESYEGSYESGSVKLANYTPLTRFMFTNDIDINGLSVNNSAWNGRNCTDPDYGALAAPRPACTRYLVPEDPFSQVGDFAFTSTGGHVHHFRHYLPNASLRRNYVARIATSWVNFDKNDPNNGDATGDKGWDFFTLTQKDGDAQKATVVYIAGHKFVDQVAGTRVILNTLLNLGADPIPSDRSVAAPTGYVDPNQGGKAIAFSSIFQVLEGTLLPGTQVLAWGTAKNWRFPSVRGDVRAHDAETGLAAGENTLTEAQIFSADGQMPLPASRNVFTYFGGYVEENPVLSGGRKVRNDVLQHGWVPERIEHTRINADFGTVPNPNCTDVLKYYKYKAKGKDGTGKIINQDKGGLTRGSDGICDLQQALQLTPVNFDAAFGIPASDVAQLEADVPEAQQFVQMVRGFCYFRDAANNRVMEPTDAQCASYDVVSDNRAHLGGAVRSSVAVVPPSSNIADAANNRRPTVAYVGTWDGQLHALYVSGGANYTGPATPRSYINPDATSTFKKSWAADFAAGTLPNAGTELWAYLPSTQLPWLKSNSARVDSSPVVQDVFIDLYGTGVRQWYTVLVASIGATGSQLFAMDVTNPLKPVLLWDITGSNHQVSNFPKFASTIIPDPDLKGTAAPLVWENVKAEFNYPPDLDPGRTTTGAFDLTELGGSRGLSVGQLREGLLPTYTVFVASNASQAVTGPGKGLIVYALDVATGQKLWQWQHEYKIGARNADNTVPPVASVRYGNDGASSLLVGDFEGRLWELDARSGANVHLVRDGASCSPVCKYPAFDAVGPTDTPQQPISSNIGVAKLPSAPVGPLASLGDEMVALFGTAGADWVPTTVGGKVHIVLLTDRRKKPVVGGGKHLDGSPWTEADARDSARDWGIFQEPAGLPLALTAPDRVYGNVTISGQVAFVPVAGGVVGTPESISRNIAGKTLLLDLGALPANATAAALANHSLANFGGVTVLHVPSGAGSKDIVIGAEVSKLTKYVELNAGASGRTSANSDLSPNQSLPYRLLNAARRFLSQQ